MVPHELVGDSWVFADGIVTDDREYLNNTTITPDAIAELIATDAAFPTCFSEESQVEAGQCGGPLEGTIRLKVLILVPASTYDLFLNHVNGYRGHYAVSVQAGDDFNQAILRQITPRLTEWLANNQSSPCNLANDVCSALEHPDSKIWENEKPWKAADYDWRVRPEITFDRWGEKANEAKPILDTLAREQGFQSTKDFVKGRKQSVKAMEQYLVSKGRDGSLYKALMGVRAPRPKGSLCTGCLNLLIKSAWMTNGAVVASPKRDRAKQLFAYGWT